MRRRNIIYYFKLGNSAKKMNELKKVYGEDTMSRGQVLEWHVRIKEGRECTEDERAKHLLSSRSDEIVEHNQHLVR